MTNVSTFLQEGDISSDCLLSTLILKRTVTVWMNNKPVIKAVEGSVKKMLSMGPAPVYVAMAFLDVVLVGRPC